MASLLVGVDTGGTFTDIVLLQNGRFKVHKILSTPDDPSRAVIQGLDAVQALDDVRVLVHGSTVATNAVLEHKGARTGLITTAGFRDVLEIGRQTRPRIYDLRVQKLPPLVPRKWRMEVIERLNERGEAIIALDEASLAQALENLHIAGVESVAISFLFSFVNPTHERKVAHAARDAGFSVSASCDVLPEFREFERTSTTVLNAYVGPLMDRYLGHLEHALPSRTSLRIMQSNGGSISSETARQEAARTLLSGPAAGVVGAAFVARASGFEQTITLDIGGTSTDVALINGSIVETTSGTLGGYPTRLPMIDIHTVGAGGGSIAWFDVGGALRVGPRSSGAYPGPAAYGSGGEEATVTDANVVLGRLLPDAFLGGTMTLDRDRAHAAVAKIAEHMHTTIEEAALGIIAVVNANMEAAMRVISVERGSDPRDYTLVAFGGAGPLHACELAEALGIPRVLIPTVPGVLSALGMVAADTLKDYVRTVMVPTENALETVNSVLNELEAQGRDDLLREGLTEEQISLERSLDLRYVGQSYELAISFAGDMRDVVERFNLAHEQRFGYSDPHEHVQVVNVRLKARGRTDQLSLERYNPASNLTPEPKETRIAIFGRDNQVLPQTAALYERERLHAGMRFQGPALIIQYDTTTVIPPLWQAQVDVVGNLLLERSVED
ncbi:hydantoinase/oxoprolinase family protein [Ktedonospora formicarum]|uniref:N-methylhydantoinase A n=1 Tax=Ktedonospora formicarum TaxID=2778364 RepID=A0A8J3HXB0_9CHLR|nr:hydantoinase/oxoprolinase family protein [Ktedonospora formicarum]GHO42765.1 N-methylhydantoinase A [Ktedonospora formicarum]